MTKKTFILMGVLIIALSPIIIAISSYLTLSGNISEQPGFYGALFLYIFAPLMFSLVLWKRFRSIGRDVRFTASFIIGLLAVFYMAAPSTNMVIMEIFPNFDPLNTLMNEISIWAKSGSEQAFQASLYAKLKMVGFNLFVTTMVSWPFFAALYFGALDPRMPRKMAA